ncbi:MAG: trimethylamine methyltransferase family protein [Candidatus Helarchaeota archaeon]
MRKSDKIELPNLNRLWKPCTKEELEIFDAAAYHILSEMGVHIDEKDALKTFKDTPVEIDEKKMIFKFPEYWIREMINKAPRSFIFAGRNPKHDMIFKGAYQNQYNGCTAAATKMYIWDSTKNGWITKDPGIEDVIQCIKFIDAIEEFDSVYGEPVMDIQSTKKGLPAELHTLFGKFLGTSKNSGITIITEGGMKEWDFAAKMGSVVAGGFDELAKRPIMEGVPACIGSLTMTRQNYWAQLASAKYHLPTAPYYGGTSPFTAPATMAGAISLNLACNYFHMAFSQFLDPGTAVIPQGFNLPATPEKGQLSPNPYRLISSGAAAQVYHELYNLPCTTFTGCLTASIEQQCADFALRQIVSQMAGINWISVVITAAAFMLESFIIAEEIIGFCNQFMHQFNDMYPTAENLALEVIKEVGPTGKYATHPHTLKHIDSKEGRFWHGKTWLMDHSDKWLADGAKRWISDIGRERIEKLKEHKPEPLPDDVIEKLKEILKEADEELAIF